MAIAPNDPRHADLTASDILSPQTWPRRGQIRPSVGLDVICTKIAVDFQGMTALTATDCILSRTLNCCARRRAPIPHFT